MKSSEAINLIWAVVVIVSMLLAAWYVRNRVKIQKLKATHPQLAELLNFAGQLALKATNYQATEDKAGEQKLADATDAVYDQIKQLYPSLPLTKATVRSLVQSAYDKQFGKAPTDSVSPTKPVQPVEPSSTSVEPVQPTKLDPKPEQKAPAAPSVDDRLDDLHL